MEESRHHYTDQNGYLCEVSIFHDDVVVFESTPNLFFDFKKHKIKIRSGKYYDYVLSYAIKDEQLFLRSIEVRLSFLSKKAKIYDVAPETIHNGKWSIFRFNDIPVEYTGTLSIGKDFDYSFWQHDEKAKPVPFCPEVYKKNGYIKFEKGKIIEKSLAPSDK